MKNRYVDMTQGSVWKILLSFSVPIFIGNVFQQLYNICDSVIVGNMVGATALAAVGNCGALYGVFISLNMGLASGVGIVVAQMFGAKLQQQIKATVINALFLLVGFALILTVAGGIWTPAFLRLMGTPDEIISDSVVYMRIMFVGIVWMSLYNCITGVLRALGDSRTPLYFLILSSVLNVLLNFFFVAVVPWGVFGVAFATLVAQFVSAVAVFVYARKRYSYFQISKEEWKADKALMGKILMVGVPLGLQSATICLSSTVLQGFVNSFGATVIAANTVINKFDNILNMPLNSLSMALSTYTGQNIGADKLERVKKSYKMVWVVAIVYSAVIFLIGHTCAEPFIRLFISDDPQIMEYGIKGIAIFSSGVMALSMIYINRSILNGAGDTGFALFIGAVEIVGRVGFAVLYVNLLQIGPTGLWYTAISNWALTGLVCFARYVSGIWKKKAVIRTQQS